MRKHVFVDFSSDIIEQCCADGINDWDWGIYDNCGDELPIFCTLPIEHKGNHEAMVNEGRHILINWGHV